MSRLLSVILVGMCVFALQVQATTVTVEFKTSTGSGIGSAPVEYYSGSWKTFGTTNASGVCTKDLADGNYKFRIHYANARTEKWQNTGVDATVKFQTALVTVELRDHIGNLLLEPAAVKYYYGGWYDFGTTSTGQVTKELLPVNYKFRMTHANARQEKWQDIGTAGPTVTFKTDLVTVELRDHNGALLLEPAAVKYYYGGWYDFGTTSTGQVTKELLPVNYKFRMTHANARQEKWQNIGTAGPTVTFKTDLVTVELRDHNGNLLAEPAAVKYYYGGWYDFGTTSTGQVTKELLPVNYKFRMTHANARQEKWQNIGIVGPTVVFQTDLVTVALKDCNGVVLTGESGAVMYYFGGWHTFGSLSSGLATKELLPVNFKFRMTHNFIRKEKWQNVGSVGPNVDFPATLTTLKSPWTIQYYAGGWRTFTQPSMYLQPGDLQFRFGSIRVWVTISGCTFGGGDVAILRLRDHNGSGLANGTARGGYGTAYGTWHVSGKTNSSGYLLDFRSGSNTTRSYEMRYNNTTEVLTQDVAVNPLYDFQTDLLTLRLETCGNVPLDGGSIRYGAGSTYGTWWFPGGATGSSAPGETQAEVLPGGQYSFEAQYKGTTQQYLGNPVTLGGSIKLIWQTTNVKLNYPGSISYGGATGDSRWFTKPSMELLAGTYKFHFRTGYRTDLTFSGCSYEKTGVYVLLKTSTDVGIPGGDVKYRFGWGSYTSLGTTDANGELFGLIDGAIGNTKIKMSYLGTCVEKEQHVPTNPNYIFQTVPVTASLKTATGGAVPGTPTYQYRYGWGTHQPFTGPMEMLPVNTKIKVSYLGSSMEWEQNVGSNPHFDFRTKAVTASLLDASGNPVPAPAPTFQYRYGWGTHQPFIGPKEMLPVNTKIKVNYQGTSVEKEQNVASVPHFDFRTKTVTAKLMNHNNTVDLTGSAAFDWRYGWGSYSSFTPSGMELLPVNTKMRVSFGGTTYEVEQNVNTSPNFNFNTVLVTASLTGTAPLPTPTYTYRYGWGSYYPFVATGTELLPVKVKVKCAAGGTTKEKEQTPTPPIYNFAFTWDGSSVAKRNLVEIPAQFELIGNYPNPFNPSTTVRYAVPEEAHVRLAVYNIAGELVAELLDATVGAGVHEVTWNAKDNPSGTYYVRMISGSTLLQRSMQLIK